MKKKLLTLAVAAALAAPAIASAEAIMYGKLNMSIDWFDVKTDVLDINGNEVELQGFNGWTLNGRTGLGRSGFTGESRANRLGVKGSEDLGNGLKAIYQIEFGVRMANEADNASSNGDSDSAVTMRNSFVGLAGNWGTFLVGRHDTPLKISTGKLDLFADTMADYNGTVGFQDIRADNAIAYISPSWSGLQFAGAIVPGGGHTVSGAYNIDSDSIAEAYSLALIYKNGPFYGSVAYESLGKQLSGTEVTVNGDLFANTAGLLLDTDPNGVGDVLLPVDGYVVVPNPNGQFVDDNGNRYDVASAPGTSLVTSDEEWTKWRFGLGLLDWNGFTLTGIYEMHDNSAFIADNKPTFWQVQAGYAFGNMMIKGMYGQELRDLDRDETRAVRRLANLVDGDKDTWAIGFDYNFSKRTTAYALYTSTTDDEIDRQDWDGFSLGMMHSF